MPWCRISQRNDFLLLSEWENHLFVSHWVSTWNMLATSWQNPLVVLNLGLNNISNPIKTSFDMKNAFDCAFWKLLDNNKNMNNNKFLSLLTVRECISVWEKNTFDVNNLAALSGKIKREKGVQKYSPNKDYPVVLSTA